jgi:anti-sigma regulatory factor (Ser/Thr protein kinase)/ActR/RegA family two-component response regulator
MEANSEIQEAGGKSRSMLVVADADLSKQLFDHLARQEWTVEFVMSNEEALLAVTNRPFDLVVTAEGTSAVEDIHLLQRIRSFRPHTRMIILTKESTTQEVILAVRERAFSYFSPPYTFESLRAMIHMAMEQPSWDDGIEVASATPAWIRLLVRCDMGTADRLMQVFDEIVDLPEEEKGHVAYAFRELLNNAMRYGGHFDPNQYVEVQYLRARRAMACRIKDPGQGFSLDELHHAAVKNPPEDPLRHIIVRERAGLPAGGYGILLSRHLVDELVYNDEGNEVLLIKYLEEERAPKGPEIARA